MAPSGRVILAAASRRGLWANSENTPFGAGRPFSRAQLEQLVREAELEPIAWSRALYTPPVSWMAPYAGALEQVGAVLWPSYSFYILLETIYQTYAVKPRGLGATARALMPGVVQPAPAAGRMAQKAQARKP
jgi:hypothetical protein